MAFLSRLTARIMQPRVGAPELTFHVIGKHPAWDDHMPDQGVANQTVLDFKQRFYVEALAGNINSGSWKHLPEPELIPCFNHRFVHQVADTLLIGGIWSSSDGKGRNLFPLIGIVYSRGLDPQGVFSAAGPILTAFHEKNSGNPTAAGLESAIEEASSALAKRIAVIAPINQLIPKLSGSQVAGLLKSAPDPRSRARLLYALRRSLLHVKDNLPDRADSFYDLVRVPGVGGDGPGDPSLIQWPMWYLSLVGRTVPVTAVSHQGRPDDQFTDLIAGAIKPASIFPLRASREKIPLCTDIPFDLDDAFISHSEAYLADCLRAGQSSAPDLPDEGR